jgi:uncharacterized protein YjiS (DUF1127 family)
MAIVYQDTIARGGFHPVQGLSAWIHRRLEIWQAKRRHARDMRDLAQFSDQELWDMGLSRSDMMALEKGVFRRD